MTRQTTPFNLTMEENSANRSLNVIVLQKRIAELEAALRVYECSGKCANCYGAVRDTKYCGQIARAALEGGRDNGTL